ncbi:hypothetical protein, partial [Bacillus pseudomycoides]|uniref:hypothetical protein n=1 Tax=Bacillus pseudomycoides TaxID=64104 RepID=UPI001C54CE6F
MWVVRHAHQAKLIGVPPHRYQAKILKYPQNKNFVFFTAPRFIFIILGATCSVRLIDMDGYKRL